MIRLSKFLSGENNQPESASPEKPENPSLQPSGKVREAERCVVVELEAHPGKMIILMYAGEDATMMALDVNGVLAFKGMINAWIGAHAAEHADKVH